MRNYPGQEYILDYLRIIARKHDLSSTFGIIRRSSLQYGMTQRIAGKPTSPSPERELPSSILPIALMPLSGVSCWTIEPAPVTGYRRSAGFQGQDHAQRAMKLNLRSWNQECGHYWQWSNGCSYRSRDPACDVLAHYIISVHQIGSCHVQVPRSAHSNALFIDIFLLYDGASEAP
ncbi:hypothetical protein ACN47E_007548 [Coniothyrium glycines]